ncbi:acyl dehydratase [Ketobacter sp. MCCC 1A13808]|uniref:MaoC family dehydratase n=1 Tax=Ketobacter sp. MCCC 1A13808 TaxID=2602738 RepID=UPI0012EC9764|nr:MaoC family dehydratase [Ketobacter sp. MCCC 1A13808]MVF12487.1 acyl dehydratase [Ketobacter sp. MCCC 1A13808]
MAFTFTPQQELAPECEVNLQQIRQPQYGRYLEEYVPGQLFVHPRGFTFSRASIDAFSRTYMQCNPLYLDLEYAKAHGFNDLTASPQMVFNVVLSLGVQNDSEKVIANLGYYNAQFLNPVYPGDTVRAMTMVVDRKERGADKPGIVTIRTLGLNQQDQVVLQYERKLMVAYRGERLATIPVSDAPTPAFPWQETASVNLPQTTAKHLSSVPQSVTGWNTYAANFKPGDIIVHNNGRTITEEHFALTYQVGNTHPLHYDKVFSQSLSGPMSGNPIVYGGLVFAWLEGLASRDLSENAIWELGFTEGYHTQPAVAGDTVFALSRILSVDKAPADLSDLAEVITVQFIGVKNMTSAAAFEEFGADLFIKENNKKAMGKDKIPAKIFEIERRLLIKNAR